MLAPLAEASGTAMNAAGFRYFSVALELSRMELAPLTTSGRLSGYEDRLLVTLAGEPVAAVRTPDNCQPPISSFEARPVAPAQRANGSSYRKLEVNTCLTSNGLGPWSARRLLLS